MNQRGGTSEGCAMILLILAVVGWHFWTVYRDRNDPPRQNAYQSQDYYDWAMDQDDPYGDYRGYP